MAYYIIVDDQPPLDKLAVTGGGDGSRQTNNYGQFANVARFCKMKLALVAANAELHVGKVRSDYVNQLIRIAT